MTFGNRLLLSKGEGVQTQRQQQEGDPGRMGMGCTSADFDLDGRIDVVAARTGESPEGP